MSSVNLMKHKIFSKEEIKTMTKTRTLSADCAFIVEDEKIVAHKLLLACCSPVFEKMFYGWPLATTEVVITDISIEEFKQVIEFFYTDSVSIKSVTHAWSLTYAARKYFIDDLVDLCCEYIESNMGLSCLLMCYEYADWYSMSDLKTKCWDGIVHYTKGVFDWDYHMRGSTLERMLSSPSLAIEESQLIKQVTQWAINECKLRNILHTRKNVWTILSEYNIAGRLQFQSVKVNQHSAFSCLFSDNELDRIAAKPKRYQSVLASVLHKYYSKYKVHHSKINRKHPQNAYYEREMYKIYKNFPLYKDDNMMTTGVMVNRKVAVFGIAVSTEHEHSNAQGKIYYGGFTVEIFKDTGGNLLLIKKFEEAFHLLKYDAVVYIRFNGYVELLPNVYYSIGIRYNITATNDKTEVMCYYLADSISTSHVTFTFLNELCGSSLRGLSFYPI